MSNEKKELVKEDWWIYEGKDALKNRKEKLDNLEKPNWRDKTKPSYTAQTFIVNKKIIEAVNAAIYLRRPLLVTGKPGTGKSTLAKAISQNLNLGEVLAWHITSKSTLEDGLYSYDALARLQNIQIKKDGEHKGLDTSISNYLRINALGTAFLSKERRVVLIDELDKSDRDLPNDLLHVFEDQEFEIEELKRLGSTEKIEKIMDMDNNSHIITGGKISSEHDFPIVIMTSNDEQEFSAAFLRRCICVEFKLPDSDQDKIDVLTTMVESHFPNEKENTKVKEVIEEFVALNHDALRSNDQLLNAIYLVLKSRAKYDDFSSSVLSAIE